jgi:nitrite reductase/ring-hydroxylating ferredoxin subunit
MNPTEMRDAIPVLGLREYWYPALPATKVTRSTPVGLRLLGDDLVFFRGRDGAVVALANVCPHRGGSLMHGDCHYRGTVACPYHGWVFDEHGECVAVLSEGPDSRIPGKVRARAYPTRTRKGMVFVWMGESPPAAIEEDVPPEFFEGDDTLVYTSTTYWPVNWRVGLENSLDSHVMYVHRNAVLQLMEPILQLGPLGYRPRTVNGKAVIGFVPDDPRTRPSQEYYPGVDGVWPKHRWRNLWLWAFRWRNRRRTVVTPFTASDEWGMHTKVDGRLVRSGGHHLPTMFRFDFGSHMYTRACVPVDEKTTRIIYYYAVRRRGALARVLTTVYFHVWYDWAMHRNFSNQDLRVMAPQRYDTPEKLSGTDAEVIAWRKLLLTARGMPRRLADASAGAAYDDFQGPPVETDTPLRTGTAAGA